MIIKKLAKIYSSSLLLTLVVACAKQPKSSTTETTATPVATGQYLYVSSGACYSGGGNTTFTNLTSSNLIYRINLTTGVKDITVADYNASPSNYGDSPAGLVSLDSSILGLVENTTTVSLRRIEKIEKKLNGARSTYSGNTTALSSVLRKIVPLNDGYYLVSKSTGVEKMKDGLNRLLVNSTYAWLTLANPPATSACITNTTLISSVAVLNNGNIVFAHAGAAMNRIGIVSAAGYSSLASCLNGNAVVAAPTANAFPTAMVYDGANNKLIVAYAGSSTLTDVNSIYVYPVNETNNTIGAGVKIYDASLFGVSPNGWNYLLYGISTMVYDSSTSSIYVATAINTNTTVTNYRIEKLRYAPENIGVNNYDVLRKTGTSAFYEYGLDTKCISGMILSE